jgi:thymidylate synthase
MKKDIFVKDEKSNVAIITLWFDKDVINKELSEYSFNTIGNLYSSRGINYLLQTLLENPIIRKIIVYGNSLTDSDKDLFSLWENGVLDKKIPNSNVDIMIDSNDVDLIRQHVELIDLRNSDLSSLKKQLVELSKLKLDFFTNPKFVEFKLNNQTRTLSSQKAGHYILEDNVYNAWIKILSYVMDFGIKKLSEYGNMQKEYNTISVTMPNTNEIDSRFVDISSDFYEKYLQELLTPECQAEVHYTYGQRMQDFKGINQINYIIDKLGENPYSRRAVAVLWDPLIDSLSSSGPCLNFLSCSIVEDELFTTIVLRSNDIYKAWAKNSLGLMGVQRHILSELNKKYSKNYGLGKFTIISISAHIYEEDWDLALKEIKANENSFENFIIDQKGYFIIKSEDEEIVVDYMSNNNEFIESFRNKNPRVIYKQICEKNYITHKSHAAYLGFELARVENCIKNNEKYIQE